MAGTQFYAFFTHHLLGYAPPMRQFTQSPLNAVETNYPAFPALPHHDWLSELLDQVTVSGVTAIHYRCTARWHMEERVVPDDMLFYITQGRATVRVEGRDWPLRPGDCAHFCRGVRHSATTHRADPIHVIALHYSVVAFESLTLPALLQFPVVFPLAGDAVAEKMLHDACREYVLQPVGERRGLEALTLRLLLHLIRQYGGHMHCQAHEARLADFRRLLPVLEILRTQLAQPIFIPELARVAGLSVAQFRRVFQRAIGRAPVEQLRRLRMERACELLRHTEKTVEAIAGEVGYAEPAFFARSFKSLIGVPPGQYRRQREL